MLSRLAAMAGMTAAAIIVLAAPAAWAGGQRAPAGAAGDRRAELAPAGGDAVGACDRVIQRAERRYGIPRNLLRAMARVESGRRIGDQVVAWAYTLNVDGQAWYADTAEDAEALVREKAATATSIDVGCMQINVRWHPIRELDPNAPDPAFATVADALDPERNVDYAARFLRDLYQREGDWTNAVARYHSGSYERRRGYVCRVAIEQEKLEGFAAAAPGGCEPPLDQTIKPGPVA